MSTKRKRGGGGGGKFSNKRSKKKEKIDSDSELSDNNDNENATQPDEILIAGHGDALDEPTQLPNELLKSMIKPAGRLMIFGLVSWDPPTQRKDVKRVVRPNLWEPHLFCDFKVRLAVSGCSASHNVIVNEESQAMTFGRNRCGQLGLEHLNSIEIPTLVPALQDMKVIGAACGRNHTLFLTDTGTVYACGDNRSGQCGVGNHQQTIFAPTRINYRGPPIIKVGCGAEFSVILDIKGGLHTFGLPEYGQLGHNTDGKYFKTNTKLCFNFVTSPKRVILYIEKSKDGHVAPVDVTEIVDFSCGQNHTVAVDSKKRAFSWGFGGFGRLGHAEQKDEYVPRLIKYLDTQARGVRQAYCGSTFCLVTTEVGALYMFGQTKRTGEANMYPKPVQDMVGWTVNYVAAGHSSVILSADDSVIAWGATPAYGELGLGECIKSSTTPKEVTKLNGVKPLTLSMGVGHTLLIAQADTPEQLTKLETFDVYEP